MTYACCVGDSVHQICLPAPFLVSQAGAGNAIETALRTSREEGPQSQSQPAKARTAPRRSRCVHSNFHVAAAADSPADRKDRRGPHRTAHRRRMRERGLTSCARATENSRLW